MCGRFTLRTPATAWAQLLLPSIAPDSVPEDVRPRFNIAPTQSIVCVRQRESSASRSIDSLRWGLVPSWAEQLAIGNRMINARSESADTKPSFRAAFKKRRCLIPADGYFEWKKVADGKQPYLIESAAGSAGDPSGVMAMAGLWEINRRLGDASGPLLTCTILTTSANSVTGQVHDRMPVLIEPPDFDAWLDSSFEDVGQLKALLKPAAEDRLRMTAVSRRVNDVRHDDESCVRPIEEV